MSTVNDYVIPRIQGTTAATEEAAVAVLDNALGTIENDLNDLASRISLLGSKAAVIRQGVPISESVGVGCFVYFNTETSLFEPALAQLESLPGSQGQSIEAPSARVEGLIIDKDGVIGTMLCGGYYESDIVARNALLPEGTATAGVYYLSPYMPGRATKETYGLLRQPVLSYYGYGKMSLSLFYMAHDGHYHSTAVLNDSNGWSPVTSDMDAPANATFVYSGTLFTDQYVGELSPDTTAVFYKGVLQPVSNPANLDAAFAIQDGNLYTRFTSVPAAGDVTVFNYFPFAYNGSVIRSIVSDNDLLTVRNVNGMVTLSPYTFTGAGTAASPLAVASLTGGTVSYTPVISDLSAGPGMSITKDLYGKATISLASQIGSLIDAWSIQHNGTTVITNGVLPFITFPAGRQSEFVMFLPVDDVPEGATMTASAWGTLYGSSASLVVYGYFIPQPNAGELVELPDTSSTANSADLNFRGEAGELSYGETALEGVSITRPGMLVARVRVPSAPANDVCLLRVGFKLAVVDAETSGTEFHIEEGSMIYSTIQAGGPINVGDAVRIDSNGHLTKCCANSSSAAGTCVGIALNTATAGAMVNYIQSGIADSGRLDLTPGTPVYINTDGSLIQIATDAEATTFLNGSAVFLQKVGIAVTTNLVQVGIEPAVLKGNV